MDKDIKFTEQALAEIDEMRNKIHDIRNAYGEESPQYIKATTSFAHVMYKIIALGGTIFRDANLSLLGHNNYITYGVIWFGDKNGNDLYPETGEWSIHS